MRKSLGEKRKQISDDQIAEIVRLYGSLDEGDRVKILANESFGLLRITVERPLDGEVGSKGRPKPDPKLRDHENVSLVNARRQSLYEPDLTERLRTPECRKAIDEYMDAEVLPYVPDAWVDHSKTKIGYEIPLTRRFCRYEPPRPLEDIDAEIKALEAEIQELLAEVTE